METEFLQYKHMCFFLKKNYFNKVTQMCFEKHFRISTTNFTVTLIDRIFKVQR